VFLGGRLTAIHLCCYSCESFRSGRRRAGGVPLPARFERQTSEVPRGEDTCEETQPQGKTRPIGEGGRTSPIRHGDENSGQAAQVKVRWEIATDRASRRPCG